VPIVLKSGRLNIPDPFGPEQASTGVALPLTYINCLLRIWGFIKKYTDDVNVLTYGMVSTSVTLDAWDLDLSSHPKYHCFDLL
jgi:hypothetical protein